MQLPDAPAAMLSASERRLLLAIARESIAAAARRKPFQPECPPSAVLARPAGVFVTIHVDGALRGCIGDLTLSEPLYSGVAVAARNAAVNDPRFTPLDTGEVPLAQIEVSVLSAPCDVDPLGAPECVQVGRDGLIVSDGFHRGLLLPQVAPHYGWDATEFLRQTCRKAGLAPDAWQRGARIQSFTAEVFSEADFATAQPA